MKRLSILLLLSVTCNMCCSTYAQGQGSGVTSVVWYIILPRTAIGGAPDKVYRATDNPLYLPRVVNEEFEYKPTKLGYKFSYNLPDGTRRHENALITDKDLEDIRLRLASTTEEPADVADVTEATTAKAEKKTKMMPKTRKLSPGSLKALAG